MKRITLCRICGSKKLSEFLDLGNQPYANSLLRKPNEKEKLYPLSLSFCSNCELVQLNHTANPKELFSNYVWVTSTSSIARKYAEVFCKDTISRIQKPKEGYILEIASNDGTFLLPFMKKGYTVLGIDPAKNIVEIAKTRGVPTRCEFFSFKTAQKIMKEFGPAKTIIARNVLPHVADLNDFVKGMYVSLANDGLLILEVHYAKKIYEELHYDSIYHEHLCYFTLKSLENLLNQNNLFIKDLKTSPISGGSIVVYAKKGNIKKSRTVQLYTEVEEKIKLNSLISWQNFANRVVVHREKLLKILNGNKTQVTVGYGASARSSTLLNYCGVGTKLISAIADQSPLKQGRLTAGTRILIDSPDHVMKKKPNFIVILAWNFRSEIIKILKEKYNYRGRYVLPLPNNPKIL